MARERVLKNAGETPLFVMWQGKELIRQLKQKRFMRKLMVYDEIRRQPFFGPYSPSNPQDRVKINVRHINHGTKEENHDQTPGRP